jgi:hypothetical protein
MVKRKAFKHYWSLSTHVSVGGAHDGVVEVLLWAFASALVAVALVARERRKRMRVSVGSSVGSNPRILIRRFESFG